MQFLWTKPTLFQFFVLFFLAFSVRASVFFFYVQHNHRYQQADSNDYHISAFTIARTGTMTRLDSQTPIFWRTPGYPLFVALFYYLYGATSGDFANNSNAHIAAIWVQLFLCSFIPIILFFLAWYITYSHIIAWLTALISVFHIGFVLAATFLLTDGLASLFFYLFLLFLFMSFSSQRSPLKTIGLADMSACALAVFTWMRPMGIFVSILTFLLFLINFDTLRRVSMRIFSFVTTFIVAIVPWYIRNYALTGCWFFCPMSGGIIQAFCAPKIIRHLNGQPLEVCMKYANAFAQKVYETDVTQAAATGHHAVRQLSALKVTGPLIAAHPFYFAYDWLVQVIKTMFDLYSSQLVAFATNSYTYDPSEEFLTEKIMACLYTAPLTWYARCIAWFELITFIALWIGLLGTCITLVLVPLFRWLFKKQPLSDETKIWLSCYLLIGGIAVMTGGWGYARLRIPIEPLMIIAALAWYMSWSSTYKNREYDNAKIIRTMA